MEVVSRDTIDIESNIVSKSGLLDSPQVYFKDEKGYGERDPLESVCESIKQLKDDNIIKAIKNHHKDRIVALDTLNNFFKTNEYDKIHYPNLDFLTYFNEYIRTDDECLCKINTDTEPIKLVKEFGRGKVGIASKIEIKKKEYIIKEIADINREEFLSIRVIQLNDTNLKWSKGYIENVSSLEYNKKLFTTKKENPENNHFDGYITSPNNPFANQTVMHMILNTILKNHVKNYIHQYDAFYCKRTFPSYGGYSTREGYSGYNITEFAQGGDLSDYLTKDDVQINSTFLYDIMNHVLQPLSILKCKKYGFVHADLKCRNVFVKLTNEKIPIFCLADFDKSSIFWKGIRFHARELGSQHVGTVDYGYQVYKDGNDSYYKLESKYILNDTIWTMYSPVPIFSTYDIYTYILSILREPKIWNKLAYVDKNNYNNEFNYFIDNAWKPLWFDDQYDDVMLKLKQIHGEYQEILKQHTPEETKEKLHELRSITQISKFMADNNYKLKLNLDKIFTNYSVKPPSFYNNEIDKFHQNKKSFKSYLQVAWSKLGKYRICVDECTIPSGSWTNNAICTTNKYSKLNKVYDNSNCTNN
jgi:hypothetical protein